MEEEPIVAPWWGSFDLEVDETAFWRLGPLTLAVRRKKAEWQVGHRREADEEADAVWRAGADGDAGAELENLQRYLLRRTDSRLWVTPVLADRPVVSSPSAPLQLLPGERSKLYVGSPLWVRLEVSHPPRPLLELPVRRPTDTWFGPSTIAGELCYGSRTQAVVDPTSLPRLWGRAVTPVVIRNEAPEELELDRLKLPAPLLSLYSGVGCRLWTEAVALRRSESSEMAQLELGRGAPAEVRGAERVGEAREAREDGGLMRAFSSLFRGGPQGGE